MNDVFGGGGADFISGTASPNVLIGNGGDDALIGNVGNDRVNGGSGSDFLSGGADDDFVESVDNAPDRIRCEGGLQGGALINPRGRSRPRSVVGR